MLPAEVAELSSPLSALMRPVFCSRRGTRVTSMVFTASISAAHRPSSARQAQSGSRTPTVKFHQLQFVEGTRMTDLYDAEPARFRRWTAAEYVDLTAEILRRLRPDIAVERIAGQTPPRIRCRRPWGNLRGDALWRMLEKRLVEKNAHQGEFFVSSQR